MCALQWFRYGNDISDALFPLAWTRKAKNLPSNILLCLIESIIDSNAINYIDFAVVCRDCPIVIDQQKNADMIAENDVLINMER